MRLGIGTLGLDIQNSLDFVHDAAASEILADDITSEIQSDAGGEIQSG